MSPPEVSLGPGRVRGRIADGVLRFLGIPYAAPPVGGLRFAPPQPPASWSVHDATRFGPGPLQSGDGLSQRLGLLGDHPTAEDCLTLNVFRPAQEAPRPRAVMVWLHGGAFQTGMAAGPAYDGSALARRGDVVVVTLNYRVGALGFLHTGVPGAGNLGLQDQLAALRFVRDEIAAFGGDPARVLLFGESAGAGSLVALLAMPAARGLFQRAIVQSAAPEGMLDAEEGRLRAALLADRLGLSADDPEAWLAGLRSLPAEKLLEAQSQLFEPGPRRIGMFFAPVVDGETLPEAPLEAVRRGAAREVELVVGTTAHEMGLYHLMPGFGELSDDQLAAYLATRLPGDPGDALERARVLARVYDAWRDDPRDRFFAAETDASLFHPSTLLAEAQARHQPRTFMYRFTWASPLEGGRLGACHALDVPFALGNLRANERIAAFAGRGPEAEQLAARMMDAWSAFARSGDPSHPGVGSWPAYAPPRRATLELGARCGVVDAPEEARRVAWAVARREDRQEERS